MKRQDTVISVLEILGISAIVTAIWLAFGIPAALGAFGVALLIFAAVLSP